MSITWVTPASCPDVTAKEIARASRKARSNLRSELCRVGQYKDGTYAVIPVGSRLARLVRPRTIVGTYPAATRLEPLSRRIAEDLTA